MTALIEALSPEAVAGLEAHFATEGCGWLVDRSVELEGDLIVCIEPCGATVALTDEFGSWECSVGHYHFTYGSPSWQDEDYADSCGDYD